MTTGVHLPGFGGATAWLNSEPLDSQKLRGRVVLVDFWTLTCINWLRTEPYVRAWWQAYRDDGLVVIGVHTPEFPFEHDVDLVRHALEDRGIDYPVVLDNDYAVWTSFANHYWPALYFADKDGLIRDEYFGEGRYEESETVLQRMLGISREPLSINGVGVEAEADWTHLHSPETYLGYERTAHFASAGGPVLDQPTTYRHPPELPLNAWSLAGDWSMEPERVVNQQPGAAIAFRFHARDAHLVLSPEASGSIPFRVTLDGHPPGAAHGVDVDADGTGRLDTGRMYQLIRQQNGIADRTLEITFDQSGAGAYVFTFG
jgi:thiol-disulfide isomerase/thioredoxin